VGLSPLAWSSLETRIQMPISFGELFLTLFSFIYYFIPENEGGRQDKNVAILHIIGYIFRVLKKELLSEAELAAFAKQVRKLAGIRRAQAARDMDVSQTSIFHAEESPEQSLIKLRTRMIEKYSGFKVVGPVFLLRPK
jgi:DNA-binding XRE family transcriptional regulator